VNAITIGPLFLPLDRFIFLIAAILLFTVNTLLERRHKLSGSGLWIALAAGFGIGRLVHVVQYWPAYQSAPWEALYLWQGGYQVWSGLIAALLSGFAWSRWRKQPIPIIIAPLVSGFVLWWGLMLAFGTNNVGAERHLPKIAVQDINGATLSVADLKGQATVINLWATWCGPCRREMPTFQRTQEQWPDIRFVFANQGEDADTVSRFMKEHKLMLNNVVLDTRGELMNEFESRGLPTTLFYDASGRLVAQEAGEMSAGRLSQYLSELSP
jgi:thiol-disulfide isomerase/thioredoxin